MGQSPTVGVRPSFPVKGVAFILGNDLAGGKVMPVLEVVDKPDCFVGADDIADKYPDIFVANVVTRAQSQRIGNDITLNDSFISSLFAEESILPEPQVEEKGKKSGNLVKDVEVFTVPVTRRRLVTEQRNDPSLVKCFSAAEHPKPVKDIKAEYVLDNELLLRKWRPVTGMSSDWDLTCQIVLPTAYRQQVLCLAHDHDLSGHLGITKTYNRILRHFFWPGLKKDVCHYCRVCQVMGKPNQKIPPAPLIPIPVIGEPFEHVILDCVGPLPKAKSGNQFLLTIMCSATRFPEAIPLRKITSSAIVKSLIKFFSTFGLPKIVQTDQGTNFLSKLFTQVLKTLGITHRVSSAYHPESQGAIERFHQTLKSMLRKYCLSSGKDWDEGVPLVLFGIRETVQESLGFSPADLVFGHTVRGPLKILKEGMLSEGTSPKENILDYVSRFRERLHTACTFAKKSLGEAQKSMKKRFDKKSVTRVIKPGDEVLVLLPVPGSALSARFAGPYVVSKKLSDTDYVVHTPDRKRKFRTCHVNMLKIYSSRESPNRVTEEMVGANAGSLTASAVIVSSTTTENDEVALRSAGELLASDGIFLRNAQMSPRLSNSEILQTLPVFLTNLTETQRQDIIKIINDFPMLSGDIPTQTNVLQHDIKITCDFSIKQHAYRVNNTKRSVMKAEVEYLLENGLAEPSFSPWSSPCLLVPKPDGTFRLCTDYRKVNSVTVPDSYPLPRMEDCIDNLGSAKFVTKLDLLKGYWQVPLTSRAAEISAFVTPDDILQYKVMAFGLRKAPATFQRLVNTVLSGVSNCDAYLDLVIYSSNWQEHLTLLRTVYDLITLFLITLCFITLICVYPSYISINFFQHQLCTPYDLRHY